MLRSLSVTLLLICLALTMPATAFARLVIGTTPTVLPGITDPAALRTLEAELGSRFGTPVQLRSFASEAETLDWLLRFRELDAAIVNRDRLREFPSGTLVHLADLSKAVAVTHSGLAGQSLASLREAFRSLAADEQGSRLFGRLSSLPQPAAQPAAPAAVAAPAPRPAPPKPARQAPAVISPRTVSPKTAAQAVPDKPALKTVPTKPAQAPVPVEPVAPTAPAVKPVPAPAPAPAAPAPQAPSAVKAAKPPATIPAPATQVPPTSPSAQPPGDDTRRRLLLLAALVVLIGITVKLALLTRHWRHRRNATVPAAAAPEVESCLLNNEASCQSGTAPPPTGEPEVAASVDQFLLHESPGHDDTGQSAATAERIAPDLVDAGDTGLADRSSDEELPVDQRPSLPPDAAASIASATEGEEGAPPSAVPPALAENPAPTDLPQEPLPTVLLQNGTAPENLPQETTPASPSRETMPTDLPRATVPAAVSPAPSQPGRPPAVHQHFPAGGGARVIEQGVLGKTKVPALLKRCAELPQLTVLRVRRQENEIFVHFAGGQICHVGSRNWQSPEVFRQWSKLAYLMVRDGLITDAQRERAFELLAGNPGLRLAGALDQLGIINVDALRHIAARLAKTTLFFLILFPEGEYRIEADSAAIPAEESIALQAEAVIREASHHQAEWTAIRKVLPRLGTCLDFMAEGHERLNQVRLSVHQHLLLSQIDGQTPLGTLCGASTMTDYEACRFLYLMVKAGVLETTPSA